MDVVVGTLFDVGGQRCGGMAALALGGGRAVGGTSGGGGDGVDHEGSVFAGGPGGLCAGVEALSFLVGLKVVALVCDEAKDLFGGGRPSGELGEARGEEGVAAGGSGDVISGCVGGVTGCALFGGINSRYGIRIRLALLCAL